MVITKKYIPRRTFLKGAGAAIALPTLGAMTPAFADEASDGDVGVGIRAGSDSRSRKGGCNAA